MDQMAPLSSKQKRCEPDFLITCCQSYSHVMILQDIVVTVTHCAVPAIAMLLMLCITRDWLGHSASRCVAKKGDPTQVRKTPQEKNMHSFNGVTYFVDLCCTQLTRSSGFTNQQQQMQTIQYRIYIELASQVNFSAYRCCTAKVLAIIGVLCLLQGSRRKVSGGAPAVSHATGAADSEVNRLSEAEVWHRLLRLMEVAKQKQGTQARLSLCIPTVAFACVRHQARSTKVVLDAAGCWEKDVAVSPSGVVMA